MDALLKVPFIYIYIYIIITLQLHGDLMDSFNLQSLRDHSQVCSAGRGEESIKEVMDILHVIKKGGFMKTLQKYYMQLEAKKEIIFSIL
jgi:hypothetical protein